MIVSRSVLFRMGIVSDESCTEIKTCILSFTTFSENRTVYEIMWKNIAVPNRPQITTWRMRFAAWLTKATDTHSEYVVLISFLRQQWLRESPSIRYTYTACPIFINRLVIIVLSVL